MIASGSSSSVTCAGSCRNFQSDVTDEQLALTTSGLNRVHLNSLLRSAATENNVLTLDKIRQKKKELIEAECVGLVEFVHPRFGLDSVGGMAKAKGLHAFDRRNDPRRQHRRSADGDPDLRTGRNRQDVFWPSASRTIAD